MKLGFIMTLALAFAFSFNGYATQLSASEDLPDCVESGMLSALKVQAITLKSTLEHYRGEEQKACTQSNPTDNVWPTISCRLKREISYSLKRQLRILESNLAVLEQRPSC